MADNNSGSNDTTWKLITVGSLAVMGWMWLGSDGSGAPVVVAPAPVTTAQQTTATAPAETGAVTTAPTTQPAPQRITYAASITAVAAAGPNCAGNPNADRRRNLLGRIFTSIPRAIAKPFRSGGGYRYVPPGGSGPYGQANPQYFGESDAVVLCIGASADGAVRHIQPLAGPSELWGPAMGSIRQWRYQPATPPRKNELAWAEVTMRLIPTAY